MATAVVLTQRTRLTPLALWHLLSLDAPTVATLWTVFAARTTHTPLPPALPIAMFLAVWLLYAADRLLDTRVPHDHATAQPKRYRGVTHSPPPRSPQKLEPRHLFHRTHRVRFAFAILIATSALAVLIPTIPLDLLLPYLLLSALLIIWFALIHLTRRTLPKEMITGLFFAAAVFIPTHASPIVAIPFAALCSLNCLYIYAWERPHTTPAHTTTRLALRYLPQLTLAIVVASLAVPTPITIAITLSALALLVLNRYRQHLPPTTLRAAADLALLTPLLVLPFTR